MHINSIPADTPGGCIPDAGYNLVGCILADSIPAGSDTPDTEQPVAVVVAAADCCFLDFRQLLARRCRHIRRQRQEALGCASELHLMIYLKSCHKSFGHRFAGFRLVG